MGVRSTEKRYSSGNGRAPVVEKTGNTGHFQGKKEGIGPESLFNTSNYKGQINIPLSYLS